MRALETVIKQVPLAKLRTAAEKGSYLVKLFVLQAPRFLDQLNKSENLSHF